MQIQRASKQLMSTQLDEPRGRGRTPIVSEELIIAAVKNVMLAGEELTVHGIAADLGVNVTTVYRHTGGLEGLRKIYAQQISSQVGQNPSAENKDWQEWITELADFYRAAFLDNPDLLRYAQAALDPGFERLEHATKTLVEYGFSPLEAVRAHAFLVNNVVGYVHQELQTLQDSNEGVTETYARLTDILQQGSDRLPTLTGLNLDDSDLDRDANFRYFIAYAVEGIAVHTSAAKNERD